MTLYASTCVKILSSCRVRRSRMLQDLNNDPRGPATSVLSRLVEPNVAVSLRDAQDDVRGFATQNALEGHEVNTTVVKGAGTLLRIVKVCRIPCPHDTSP